LPTSCTTQNALEFNLSAAQKAGKMHKHQAINLQSLLIYKSLQQIPPLAQIKLFTELRSRSVECLGGWKLER
jgi:hypothetical protein